jgi:predicted GH43/DUF377 family glycosyl hydrolase
VIGNSTEVGSLIPGYLWGDKHVVYYGENAISVATSRNMTEWEIGPRVLHPHQDFYGTWPLTVASVARTHEGILVFYYAEWGKARTRQYLLHAALFDCQKPTKLVTKYQQPIWETPPHWKDKKVKPVGVAEYGGQLLSFWWIDEQELIVVYHPLYRQIIEHKTIPAAVIFTRMYHNPLISPHPDHEWESRATFNPAAFVADDRVHLVYRAIGNQDISVLGYAESRDGLHIDTRHPDPVYVPSEPFEVSGTYTKHPYSPYASGGGCWGGCEDPRLTNIDDILYMTYVAYDGWRPPRVALTSIQLADFLAHKWDWKKPVLISQPNMVDKNACILPEKINNKYVVFHRVYPNILVDFVDSLDFDGDTFLKGEYKITPRPEYWDSRKLGAGAPPIKTDKGWLLLYQAVDNKDDRKYKIGAMLLDANDPTRVLHRTNQPLLEPTHWYENVGHKAGVVYPCGAVHLHDQLIMYYGGADTVVCAATAPMGDFLNHLITSEVTKFEHIEPVLAY